PGPGPAGPRRRRPGGPPGGGAGAGRRPDDPGAERAARDRVRIAKVALGERGTPWWEQDGAERAARWRDGLAALDA
ncbi:hypothetical protein, partial [Streptomyces sp. NPDC057939]|uniref:hypothetical protein n=1 Tax=Streptomyces sp. NPDC057939 TaxID=3346284 RepID=UPI0036EAEFDD